MLTSRLRLGVPALARALSDRRSLDFHKQVLGLKGKPSVEEIKAAFRAKAKESHPDVSSGSDKRFRLQREAYEALLEGMSGDTWVREDNSRGSDGVRAEPEEDRIPTVRELVSAKDFGSARDLWDHLDSSGICPLSVGDIEGGLALAVDASGVDAALALLTRLHDTGRLPTAVEEVSYLYNTMLWHVGGTRDFDSILAFLAAMDGRGVTYDQAVIQGIFTKVPRS